MPGNPPCKGDVWLANIPEGQGHEQKGQRPVVVGACVQNAGMLVVFPATSNPAAERFPFTYKLKASKNNGLYSDSIVLVFQIRAIDNTRLVHKMGEVEPKEMQAVDGLVKDLLKL